MKRVLAGSLVIGLLVGVLMLGSPLSASAAPTPDFTPSGNSAREYVLNVLGKMLGNLTPNKWKAENLANAHRYNHSWEGLAAQFGTDPANPNYSGAPDSYQDYVLKKTDLDMRGGYKGAKFKVAATKFLKLAGPIGAGLVGTEIGFAVGKQSSTAMGLNVTGGLCEPGFEDGGMISLITGTDCSGMFELSPDYDANGDVVAGVGGARVCGVGTAANQCLRLAGSSIVRDVANYEQRFYLFVPENYGGVEWTAVSLVQGSEQLIVADNSGPAADQCRGAFGAGSYCLNAGLVLYGDDSRLATYQVGWDGPTATIGENDPDPERVLSCSVTGDNGQTYTSQSSTYRESDGAIASPECPALPEGVMAVGVKVEEDSPAGTRELYDEPTTPEYQDWYETYPECRTGACKLDLLQKPLTGPAIASCFDLAQQCVDWFEQPNKADLYQCRYGVHDVELEQCYVYAGVFKPERVAIGAPYSDPITGEWSGGQSSPKAGAELMSQTVLDPEFNRNCWSAGWAEFNPVEWIMQPVKCALEWAFVPRPAVVALEFEKVNAAWTTTPPGVVLGTIGAWNLDLDLAGCGGFPITWQDQTVHLLDACPGTVLAPVASTSKTISSVVLALLGIGAVISIVAGIIGYRGLTVSGGNH